MSSNAVRDAWIAKNLIEFWAQGIDATAAARLAAELAWDAALASLKGVPEFAPNLIAATKWARSLLHDDEFQNSSHIEARRLGHIEGQREMHSTLAARVAMAEQEFEAMLNNRNHYCKVFQEAQQRAEAAEKEREDLRNLMSDESVWRKKTSEKCLELTRKLTAAEARVKELESLVEWTEKMRLQDHRERK